MQVGTARSSWVSVDSGVPQGSVLGPLLFLFFINDLPAHISSESLLFADDLKLYRIINNFHDFVSLQKDIKAVSTWAHNNGLELNITKCKVLHLGSFNPKYSYLLHNTPLPNVSQVKDLGVIIDSNLKFHSQALAASAKARQVGNYLLKYLSYTDCPTLKILINSYIRPHLEYCIQAWRPYYHKSFSLLERTFRHFTKRCPATHHLSYPERLKALGLRSLSARFDRGDMLQTFKILRGFDEFPENHFFVPSFLMKTRGHLHKLQPMPFRTNIRKGCFSQRTVLPWNQLPPSVVEATSVTAFKIANDNFKLFSFFSPLFMGIIGLLAYANNYVKLS